jgi:hypothetical protein
MTDPIKLTDDRVRQILAHAADAPSTYIAVEAREEQALAQAVLDLRCANAMLEAALKETDVKEQAR